MTFFFYETLEGETKPILLTEFKAIEPVKGYRRLPNGAKIGIASVISPYALICPFATIEPFAKVGIMANVGSYSTIRANATIRPFTEIGAFAKVGSNADISSFVSVGSYAVVFQGVSVDAFSTIPPNSNVEQSISFTPRNQKSNWNIEPLEPGIVRFGDMVGSYDAIRNRESRDWLADGFGERQISTILATLDYFQAIESVVFSENLEVAK